MKKQNLKSLKLNKKSISNIQSEANKGGANTFTSYWAYCPTRDIDCGTRDHTACWCNVDR